MLKGLGAQVVIGSAAQCAVVRSFFAALALTGPRRATRPTGPVAMSSSRATTASSASTPRPAPFPIAAAARGSGSARSWSRTRPALERRIASSAARVDALTREVAALARAGPPAVAAPPPAPVVERTDFTDPKLMRRFYALIRRMNGRRRARQVTSNGAAYSQPTSSRLRGSRLRNTLRYSALRSLEPLRRADQLVDDAGLGHGVAAVRHDAEVGLRPGAVQVPGDRRPACRDRSGRAR